MQKSFLCKFWLTQHKHIHTYLFIGFHCYEQSALLQCNNLNNDMPQNIPPSQYISTAFVVIITKGLLYLHILICGNQNGGLFPRCVAVYIHMYHILTSMHVRSYVPEYTFQYKNILLIQEPQNNLEMNLPDKRW